MRRSRIIVSYDATCGLCQWCIRWLIRLDWLGRFECVPIDELSRALAAQELPALRALERAIHVFHPDGAIMSGAPALRSIGLRLPLLAIPALALYLPFALGWAERGYRWVSARRHDLSRHLGCPPGHCSPPSSDQPAPEASDPTAPTRSGRRGARRRSLQSRAGLS